MVREAFPGRRTQVVAAAAALVDALRCLDLRSRAGRRRLVRRRRRRRRALVGTLDAAARGDGEAARGRPAQPVGISPARRRVQERPDTAAGRDAGREGACSSSASASSASSSACFRGATARASPRSTRWTSTSRWRGKARRICRGARRRSSTSCSAICRYPWLAPYLHLIAGHRRLCAGELESASGSDGATAIREAQRQLAVAHESGSPLIKVVAEYLATTARPCSPLP